MAKKRPAIADLTGWITTRVDSVTDLHVRVGEREDGQMVVTDLMVSAPEITTDLLRRLHPARVLAEAGLAYDDPGDPTTSGASRLRQIAADRAPDDDLKMGQLRSRSADWLPPAHTREPLGRPEPEDPTFYQRVAVAYRSAAMASGRPAMVLAEENGVPVETVRRWVKEARRRGFLAAGSKGRAL